MHFGRQTNGGGFEPPNPPPLRTPLIRSQNTIMVYTDGSKIDGRVDAGSYAEYPNNSPKQAFFHLGIHSTVFQAEVLAISEVAKDLLLEKNAQSTYYCTG